MPDIAAIVLNDLMRLAFDQSIVGRMFQNLPIDIHPDAPVPPVWVHKPPFFVNASLSVSFPTCLAPGFADGQKPQDSIATGKISRGDAQQLPIMGLDNPTPTSRLLVSSIDGQPQTPRLSRKEFVPDHCLSLSHPSEWGEVQIGLFWKTYLDSIKTGLAVPGVGHLIGRRNSVGQFEVGRVAYCGDNRFVDVDIVIKSPNTPNGPAIWDLLKCCPLVPPVDCAEEAEPGLRDALLAISGRLKLPRSVAEQIEIKPEQVELIASCIDGLRVFSALSCAEWNCYFWDQWGNDRLKVEMERQCQDFEAREKARNDRLQANVDAFQQTMGFLVKRL